jgi:hypothetical protein
MTDAADTLRRIWRSGGTPTPGEICDDITTEVELEQYRIGLRARGALSDDANGAIARRRIELQRAKGVRGSDRT